MLDLAFGGTGLRNENGHGAFGAAIAGIAPPRERPATNGARRTSERRRLLALLAVVAVVPRCWGASALAAPDKPSAEAVTLGVATIGALPGFSEAALAPYVVGHMDDAHLAAWRFRPVAPKSPLPPDRVEWTFKFHPFAGGSIRQIAPMAAIERMFGVHRVLIVEARLYLGGEYQTVALGQATIQGGPNDKALGATIATVTASLLGDAGAYRAIAPAKP